MHLTFSETPSISPAFERGWPELEPFTSFDDADGIAEWWQGFDRAPHLLEDALRLASLVFNPDDHWCRRRVINLRFLEERRGDWESSVDFTVPSSLEKIALCNGGKDRYWIPLAMYRKTLLPITHMKAVDETDAIIPTASSAISTQLAFAILMGLASRTDLGRALPTSLLWEIASPNLVAVESALDELITGRWATAKSEGDKHQRREFLLGLRILSANSFVVLEIPKDDRERQRVIRLSSDGPIRVSRRFWEAVGWRPLTVAPRVVFGGNALTYHMEIDPPSQVLVADSRLLFSWFQPSTEPIPEGRGLCDTATDEGAEPAVRTRVWRWWVQGSLRRGKQEAGDDALTTEIRGQHMNRCWDSVTGSAEPMTGHIRASNRRLPTMIMGREIFGIFQIFPQYMGQLPQYVLVALVNVLFLGALAFGLDGSLPTYRPALDKLFDTDPEILLIAALAVVGIGGSQTILRREHELTTFVLQPWRNYVFAMLVLTSVNTAAILWCCLDWFDKAGRTDFVSGWLQIALLTSFGASVFLLVVISITVWRIRDSETRGSPGWTRTGLRFRRALYQHGVFPDEHTLAEESAGGSPSKSNKIDHDAMIKALYVDQYLKDEPQRELGNRGVPPSIRHEPDQRGI